MVGRTRVVKRGELCRTKSVGDDCGKTMERQAKEKMEGRYQGSMVALGLVEEDAQDRVIGRQHIRTGDPV